MEQWLLELEEMAQLFLETSLIEVYNGHTLKLVLTQKTKSPLMIVFTK